MKLEKGSVLDSHYNVGLWKFDGFITDAQFLHSRGILDTGRTARGNIPDKASGTAEPKKAVVLNFKPSVTKIDELQFHFNPPWYCAPSSPCSGFLLALWTWVGLTDMASSIIPAFDLSLHTRNASAFSFMKYSTLPEMWIPRGMPAVAHVVMMAARSSPRLTRWMWSQQKHKQAAGAQPFPREPNWRTEQCRGKKS